LIWVVLASVGEAVQAPCDAPGGDPSRIVLFDGQSLNGWKPAPFPGAGKVEVDNGVILLNEGNAMTGITSTRRDLPTSDYELIYEAMRRSGSDFFAAATFPVMKTHITLVNGGWGGTVTGLSSINGADASENETSQYHKYQAGTWYRFRVRVTDRMIRCWIDEKEIITLNHDGLNLGTRIETNANKPLGFATWETSGALRKIEIRKLTPDEIAATNRSDG
jgi:hypothetical protein